jgi:hypothetical protein
VPDHGGITPSLRGGASDGIEIVLRSGMSRSLHSAFSLAALFLTAAASIATTPEFEHQDRGEHMGEAWRAVGFADIEAPELPAGNRWSVGVRLSFTPPEGALPRGTTLIEAGADSDDPFAYDLSITDTEGTELGAIGVRNGAQAPPLSVSAFGGCVGGEECVQELFIEVFSAVGDPAPTLSITSEATDNDLVSSGAPMLMEIVVEELSTGEDTGGDPEPADTGDTAEGADTGDAEGG